MSEFILERSRITVLSAQRLLSYIWKSIVLCSSDHVFFRLHILHSPGRCLRSSNQKLLLVPRSRLSAYEPIYEPVYYFRILLDCFVLQFVCILIPFKRYCSAQWFTIVVLLCFINTINEITNQYCEIQIK